MTSAVTHRRHDHLPAYGPLRLGIEVLGLFEERHERNFGTHADEQEQKELRHQGEIDDREIHWCSRLACRRSNTTSNRFAE